MTAIKILISNIAWGKDYVANTIHYSLASLLSQNNIPAVTRDHSVTILLLMEAASISLFKNTRLYQESKSFIHYDLRPLEAFGFNPTRIPSGHHGEKYHFLSVCQNIAINISRDYDIHVFNYADFVWADGSLMNLVSMYQQKDFFALLGFCPPVDEQSAKAALAAYKGVDSIALTVPPMDNAAIAIDHLHSEAKLRHWGNESISGYPSYIYWHVQDEGIIIRAFHQTLLAVASGKPSAVYQAGITNGTLDGNFSSAISAQELTEVATDSSKICVFSMHSSFINSEASETDKREVLKKFVTQNASSAHRESFKTAILLKRTAAIHPSKWQAAIEQSLHDTAFIDTLPLSDPQTHAIALDTRPAWLDTQSHGRLYHYLANWLLPPLKYKIKKLIINSLRRRLSSIKKRLFKQRRPAQNQ